VTTVPFADSYINRLSAVDESQCYIFSQNERFMLGLFIISIIFLLTAFTTRRTHAHYNCPRLKQK